MQKFEKNYQIRSYECDNQGFLRLVTLMNILQDMADSHADKLGLGIDFCIKNGYAWFGSNYQLKIQRLPKIHETVKIQTWPAEKKKLGAVRDFAVFDSQNNVIITASSLWILIDFARKRPVSLEKAISNYEPLAERALLTDFEKIPLIERSDKACSFQTRYDDIDFNQHVNNAIYLLWATECMDYDFRLKNIPHEIEIAFKKECHLGEKINIRMQQEKQLSTYEIRNDENLLSQVRILWRAIA